MLIVMVRAIVMGMVMRGDNRGQGDSDGCSHAR